MNELDWKRMGWKITRKLIYYAILILVLIAMFTAGFSLMSMANTLFVAVGLLLIALTVGIGITALIREVLYYASHCLIPPKEQNKNEE
jgi:membrane protein implicated in regulation of membrane protease activity